MAATHYPVLKIRRESIPLKGAEVLLELLRRTADNELRFQAKTVLNCIMPEWWIMHPLDCDPSDPTTLELRERNLRKGQPEDWHNVPSAVVHEVEIPDHLRLDNPASGRAFSGVPGVHHDVG